MDLIVERLAVRVIEIAIQIDRKNKQQPLFMQVFDQVKSLILSGHIQNGQRLPSIRQLAIDLTISKNTVSSAYELLVAEGLLVSKTKVGYIVTIQDTHLLQESAYQLGSVPVTVDPEDPVIDFAYGNVERNDLPYKEWRSCLEAAMDQQQFQLLPISDPYGEPALKAQMTHYLRNTRGIECESDEIIIGTGAQQLLFFLSSVFKRIGIDGIAIEEPTYDGARYTFEGLFHTENVTFSNLKKCKADAMYVHTSHRIADDLVMTLDTRKELLAWAKDTNRFLIEDDYESEYRNQHELLPSIKAFDQDRNHVIYIGALSPTIFPFERLGYMIIPRNLVNPFLEVKNSYEQPISKIIQTAVAAFMEAGCYEGQVRRMRTRNAKKVEVLRSSIEAHFQDRVKLYVKDHGIHALLDVRLQKDEKQLLEEAARVGVHLYHSSQFQKDGGQNPILLLGFSGVPSEKIEKAIQKLASAWL